MPQTAQCSYAGSLRLSARSSAVELSLLLGPHWVNRGLTSQPADLSGQAGLSPCFICLEEKLNISAVDQICLKICGIEDGMDDSMQWYSGFSWNDIVPDFDQVMKIQKCQRDSEDLDVCG